MKSALTQGSKYENLIELLKTQFVSAEIRELVVGVVKHLRITYVNPFHGISYSTSASFNPFHGSKIVTSSFSNFCVTFMCLFSVNIVILSFYVLGHSKHNSLCVCVCVCVLCVVCCVF